MCPPDTPTLEDQVDNGGRGRTGTVYEGRVDRVVDRTTGLGGALVSRDPLRPRQREVRDYSLITSRVPGIKDL